MVDVRTTSEFRHWFDKLDDRRAKARIRDRLIRVQSGHFGVVRAVGDGLSELKIDYGPGYRLYYVMRVDVLILCGGTKGSQGRDIKRARSWRRSMAMTRETRIWDPADGIETADDVMFSLEAALEDYDPGHFAKVLGILARSQGMGEVAEKAGVTRDALYKGLTLDGDMRLSTLFGVLRALEIEIRLKRRPAKRRKPKPQAGVAKAGNPKSAPRKGVAA